MDTQEAESLGEGDPTEHSWAFLLDGFCVSPSWGTCRFSKVSTPYSWVWKRSKLESEKDKSKGTKCPAQSISDKSEGRKCPAQSRCRETCGGLPGLSPEISESYSSQAEGRAARVCFWLQWFPFLSAQTEQILTQPAFLPSDTASCADCLGEFSGGSAVRLAICASRLLWWWVTRKGIAGWLLERLRWPVCIMLGEEDTTFPSFSQP